MRSQRTGGRTARIRRYFPRWSSLWSDTRGANLVEYIILIGVVALLAIIAFKYFNVSIVSKVQAQGNTVMTMDRCIGKVCILIPDSD